MMFIKGLLFGLTLQLSIGPCFFAILHKAIRQGFLEAFKMVLGVALVDAFYICLSFTFIGGFLKVYFLSRIILWGGALVLIMFGVSYIRSARKKTVLSIEPEIPDSRTQSFIYGIKLTSTNPMTILFWSSTFGVLISSKVLSHFLSTLLYSMGCVSATIIFLGTICFIGRHLERFLSNSILQKLDYAVGGFLMIFGVKMLL